MNEKPQSIKFHISAIWAIIKNKITFKTDKAPIEMVVLSDEKIKLLSESPNTDVNQLKFGHSQIINALKNVISASSSSMTVGLFGGWGTGKSSIVENLKISLKADCIPVVIFDVWKHDGDALRRTFLRDMDLQLSDDFYGKLFIKDLNILSPQVFKSMKESSEKVNIKTQRFFYNLLILFLLSFVLFGALFLSCFLIQFFTKIPILDLLTESKAIGSIGALLTTGLTGGLIFKYLDNFIKVEKSEEQKEKLQDPHEFEVEFHRLVNNLRPEINTLVVVFDNLDRVPGDNVLKVIATIKTFLDFKSTEDNKRVIFLIPCDANAIKTHIEVSLNTNDPSYIDEFLRKFFNTTLWIPEFYENELEDFATEKLKETNVIDFQDEKISWLVIRAFHKNPRQIVQFINILLANYLLIKEFCENNAIQDKNFYKTNLTQLAKFLVLKMCFPNIIGLYQEKGIYNLYDGEVSKLISKDDLYLYEEYQLFKEMLERTREIIILNLEPYFKFRLSKDEQEIPDLNKIMDLISYGRDSLDFNQEMIVALNISALSNAIRNKFQATKNSSLKMSFFRGCLQFAEKVKITYNNHLYKDLLDFLVQNIHDVHVFEPKLISDQLLLKISAIPQQDTRRIVNQYAHHLQREKERISDELSLKILHFFTLFVDYLTKTDIDSFVNILVTNYKRSGFLDYITKNDKIRDKLFTDQFKTHIVNEIGKVTASDQFFIFSILPNFSLSEQAKQILTANFVKSFKTQTVTYQSDQIKIRELINYTELILAKFYFEKTSDSALQFSLLLKFIKEQQDNIRFVSIIPYLINGIELFEESQEYLESVINAADLNEIKIITEKININDILSSKNLLLLYNRSLVLPQTIEVILAALTKVNQLLYFQFFIEKNSSANTHVFPQTFGMLSLDEFSLIDENIIKKLLRSSAIIPFFDLQRIMNILSRTYIDNSFEISPIYIELVIMLINKGPNSLTFQIGIQQLELLISSSEIDKKPLATALINTMASYDLYNVRKLYEILFNIFEYMSSDAKKQLRDLIYLNLLHHLGSDVSNLETALYAVNFSGELDFHGCENYFGDFAIAASNFTESEVFSYYINLIKLILPKIKKYRSKVFIEIKASLKKLITKNK